MSDKFHKTQLNLEKCLVERDCFLFETDVKSQTDCSLGDVSPRSATL